MRPALLISAWALAMMSCADSKAVDESELAPGVTYEFVWDGDGVTKHTDGTWSVTSDLGYEVRVALGWLSISTVQLVPCDDASAASDAPFRLHVLDWLLGTSVATAGHGATETDPSAVLDGALESVAPSARTALGPAAFESHDYCAPYHPDALRLRTG